VSDKIIFLMKSKKNNSQYYTFCIKTNNIYFIQFNVIYKLLGLIYFFLHVVLDVFRAIYIINID